MHLVRELRAELEVVHADLLGNWMDESKRRLHVAFATKDAQLRQKPRVLWLKKGDQNSTFFFCSIKAKYSKETIKVLYTNAGDRVDQFSSIKEEAIRFYQQLLGTADFAVCCPFAIDLAGIMHKRTSEEQGHLLDACVTNDEIHAALFAMDDSKSPGPDGLTGHFFK